LTFSKRHVIVGAMSFPQGILQLRGMAQPQTPSNLPPISTPIDLKNGNITTMNFFNMQVAAVPNNATGVFAPLATVPSNPLVPGPFQPMPFQGGSIASLWTAAVSAGQFSFDVTSMLVKITSQTFLAQGNGVANLPNNQVAFCAFSISAQWNPTDLNLATQIVAAYFGAYVSTDGSS
jgi:hypothetical protein